MSMMTVSFGECTWRLLKDAEFAKALPLLLAEMTTAADDSARELLLNKKRGNPRPRTRGKRTNRRKDWSADGNDVLSQEVRMMGVKGCSEDCSITCCEEPTRR
jgi:hypothetical protein